MKRAWLRLFLRRPVAAAAIATAVAAVAWFSFAPVTPTIAAPPSHDSHAGHPAGVAMSDAEMEAGVRAWFAKHPEKRGEEPLAGQGGFGDTVLALSSTFDSGEPGDIDTAFVLVGEAVLWRWVSGFHTVTNGEDSNDPSSGSEYNAALDSAHPTFSHTFTEVGVFPFYCVIHEFLAMKGYVKVRANVGVTPVGPVAGRVGFVTAPAPNPSRGGFTFRFALRERGRVSGDVIDAAGRSVSTVLDRDLEAGTYAAAWNGRRRDGAGVRPGVYWVRLSGPGFGESRKVVVQR